MKSEIIINRERAKQLLAFDGMLYGKCRPTDIDVSMDFQGRTFVFVELKGNRKPLTMGQKLHLQALVDGLKAGGKEAWAILAHHDTPDHNHDVDVKHANVSLVYNGDKWNKPEIPVRLHAAIAAIHKLHQGS